MTATISSVVMTTHAIGFAANIIEEGIKRKQEKTGKTREEIIEEAISESELVQSDEIHKKALEIAKKKK